MGTLWRHEYLNTCACVAPVFINHLNETASIRARLPADRCLICTDEKSLGDRIFFNRLSWKVRQRCDTRKITSQTSKNGIYHHIVQTWISAIHVHTAMSTTWWSNKLKLPDYGYRVMLVNFDHSWTKNSKIADRRSRNILRVLNNSHSLLHSRAFARCLCAQYAEGPIFVRSAELTGTARKKHTRWTCTNWPGLLVY